MRILKARSRHLDGVMAIENSSFSDPWSRASMEAYLDAPDGELLVLEKDGQTAGFAVYHVSWEDAELYNLAVGGGFRRQGLGRALLDEVLVRAKGRGAERMYLEVRRSNAAAIALYRAAGFAVCGVRRDYYSLPTEDALLMDIILISN